MANCPLASVSNYVPGEGPTPCDYMFIAEAPGKWENKKLRPMVGDSGTRLNVTLEYIGLDRADVYVTNVEKHQPPKNRKPKKAELEACAPDLWQELAEVRPRVIVTMGDTAAKWFDPTIQLKKDHGKPRVWCPTDEEGVHTDHILVPTYHPAYTLRNPNFWPVFIEDMQAAVDLLKPEVLPTKYWLGGPAWDDTFTAVNTGPIAIDLETTSPKHPYWIFQADIVGHSLSRLGGEAIYMTSSGAEGLNPAPVTQKMFDVPRTWVAHNAKFETIQLMRAGLNPPVMDDTKIAAYLLGKPSTHLKHLTKQELGIEPITYEVATQGRDMGDIPPAEIVDYAAADADHTLQLWGKLSPELERLGLDGVYNSIEKPLVPVLARMEMRGIKCDRREALRARLYFHRLMREATERAHNDAGLPLDVSPTSHDQLGAWLDSVGAPCRERTDIKLLPKTDISNLKWLAAQGWRPALMEAILDLKEKQKLRSFAASYYKLSAWDGALHPSINQCGHDEETSEDSQDSPASGRLSVSNPNLSQIPNHGLNKPAEFEEYGRVLRRCLVARPGYVLLAADVGQQEPRVAALTCPIPEFQETFDKGGSIYGPFAEALYGRPIDKAADVHQWNVAKKCVLSFLWRSTNPKPWIQRLMEMDDDLSMDEAKAANRRVVKAFPSAARFRDRVKLELREHGYVRDWFGRIRWLPGAFDPDRRTREAALREGMNQHIQGPAASSLKLAMIWLDNQFRYVPGLEDVHLLLPIHDELVMEVPVDLLPRVAWYVGEMGSREVHGMPIDFPIEIKVGPNLGDMVPYQAALGEDEATSAYVGGAPINDVRRR